MGKWDVSATRIAAIAAILVADTFHFSRWFTRVVCIRDGSGIAIEGHIVKGIRDSRSDTEVDFPIVGRVIASRRSRTKDQVAGNMTAMSRVLVALKGNLGNRCAYAF